LFSIPRLERGPHLLSCGGVQGLAPRTRVYGGALEGVQGKAVRAYSGLRLKYDYSGDGSITGAEGELAFGSLKAGRR
jgi:hypothetical protein